MSILNNTNRLGNFTSSNIHKLMSLNKAKTDFGAPAITYIHEKNLERKLGIALNTETNAKETSWGLMMEDRIFDMLGLEYTKTSTETDIHPNIPYWSGSKDGTKEGIVRAVYDFKAPFTRKSFCGLVMPLYCGLEGIDAINALINGFEHEGVKYPAHPSGEAYYLQLVSNGIINNINFAELIVYMPYQSELLAIREANKDNPSCRWMNYATEEEIPYLPDGGFFKNLNIIRFEIPQAEKEAVTANVLKAGKMLIQRPEQSQIAA
jgi:hypothetical protein